MEKFVEACVETYKELARVTDLRDASVAFLPDAAEDSIAGRPVAIGDVIEYRWCFHTFPPVVHAN
eukprot:6443963-Lingulodinium_polyedra.AAC.1